MNKKQQQQCCNIKESFRVENFYERNFLPFKVSRFARSFAVEFSSICCCCCFCFCCNKWMGVGGGAREESSFIILHALAIQSLL